MCHKPSRALVQAQPLEGSLIIWISSITATSSTQTNKPLTQSKCFSFKFLQKKLWRRNLQAEDVNYSMHNAYVVTEHVDWCSPIMAFAKLQINGNECTCLRYLQGVVTLHISMVQATWAAARPSGSMKILSSPVTKSHITPCKQTRDPFPK